MRPLSINASLPEVGERVVVIGSPLGLEQTVSDGIVSAVREVSAFGTIIQITAPISPGSSGSPVVNMKGEVIGVATFQSMIGQNLNFAIPGERIAKLTKIAKGKRLQPPISLDDLTPKRTITIAPLEVIEKWKSVKLVVEDRQWNSVDEYSVNIGDEMTIPESNMVIKVVEFLPDLKIDERREKTIFTSETNELINPAVHVVISENGMVIFKCWLLSLFPNIDPIRHDRFRIILKEPIERVPPTPSQPTPQEKGILQEEPQVQEKSEGLSDWWRKNKESLISKENENQKKLTIPPPSSLPSVQAHPEGLNDWWKKNKEYLEAESKNDQPPVVLRKSPQAEDMDLGFPPIYFDSIKNKINMYWLPTPGDFPTSDDLTVVLAFKIKPSGEVEDVMVEEGSGNTSFDTEAISAVLKANPLPPFPEGSKEKELKVHLTFIGEAIR